MRRTVRFPAGGPPRPTMRPTRTGVTTLPDKPGFPGIKDVGIALVGAGPRGTSVLERLCASAPELLRPGTRPTVRVVDPAPPGPGQVWRTAQSPTC
jgi:hypothetical protein